MPDFKKRETANKIRIGDLLRAKQIFEESEQQNKRLQSVELGDQKIVRVNIISNVVDKFESEGESRFASITLDDGSGQIRARLFGEDTAKFKEFNQGDTVTLIGLVRSYNQELYLLPEIIRKTDPRYLLVRKLELEKEIPKILNQEQKQQIIALKDEIIEMIKTAELKEGIEKEEIIMKLKHSQPEVITKEIKKLLEEGIIYEPKPGKVRYLG
ncbi:MAG: OB-fold nucleic acid binding domain-containing protein [Nanoarchaeota archaeon]